MNKKKLLSEDLKRYQQLLEYTFYVPEEEDTLLLLEEDFNWSSESFLAFLVSFLYNFSETSLFKYC